MLTIKVFLTESGRLATMSKDFPLYRGQFQNVLLNVYVPTSILAPEYYIQHYAGRYTSGTTDPTSSELTAFVLSHLGRAVEVGDVVDFTNTSGDNQTYKRFIYSAITEGTTTTYSWVANVVDFFNMANVAGTTLNCSVVSIARNGAIVQGQYYSMRYLKKVTIDNTEYALYERKLPKEFTYYSGAGTQAPNWVFNVQNVDTDDNSVISIVTSQTIQVDVLPSTLLDNDYEETDTWKSEIDASINTLNETLQTKQNITDQALTTTAKTIVGAINELDSEIVDLDGRVTDNEGDIEDLEDRVGDLEDIVSSGELYIGTYTYSASGVSDLPSTAQLNAYVYSQVARQPQGNDVVIVIQQLEGATDKNYKYIYGANGWVHYEIPAIEKAGNGTLGIVKGTSGFSGFESNNVRANIDNGVIKDISTYDNSNTDKSIKTYLNGLETTTSTNTTSIANILNGTSVVKKAEQDGVGNNIADTYLTQNAGASKVYVKDYALPKEFNIAHYLSSDHTTFTDTATDSSYTITTSAIGYVQIFDATWTVGDIKFQLADKNGYITKVKVSSDINKIVRFLLTTYIQNDSSTWVQASVETSTLYSLTAGDIITLSFENNLYSLSQIYDMASGSKIRQKLEVVSTDSTTTTYTIYTGKGCRLYVSTTSYAVISGTGLLGEQGALVVESATATNNKVVLKVSSTAVFNANCEYYLEVPATIGNAITNNQTYPIYISRDNTENIAINGYVNLNAKCSDFGLFRVGTTDKYYCKLFYVGGAFELATINTNDLAYKTYVDAQDTAYIGKITSINANASYSNNIISATLPVALEVGKEYKFKISLAINETTFTDSDEFILYDTSSNAIQLNSTLNTNPDTTMVGSEFAQFQHYDSTDKYTFEFIGIYNETTSLGTTTRYIYVDKAIVITTVEAVDYKNISGVSQGMLKFVKCSQSEYDALSSYDANTLYIIVG